MTHKFTVHSPALKRQFSVYVVIAMNPKNRAKNAQVYVGKTGDNRAGCNPVISRCGNHFSYNNIHSQIRNKIKRHQNYDYVYIFNHFSAYTETEHLRKRRVDQINEMERWLNQKIQELIKSKPKVNLVNPYLGRGHLKKEEQKKRAKFRKKAGSEEKLNAIVEATRKELKASGH